MQNVLERFRKHGAKLRYYKCKFRTPLISYIEQCIDQAGLHPTEKNVDAVVNAPKSPENLNELRYIIGMKTFYSKFLANKSDTLFSLHQLDKTRDDSGSHHRNLHSARQSSVFKMQEFWCILTYGDN